MNAPAPIPEVYVLWHPDCQLGALLAPSIYAWLRPRNGQGPEVFYRSLTAPEAPLRGLPPPLPGETRGIPPTPSGTRRKPVTLQVVLTLIDAHMVADPAWRYWLGQLAAPGSSVRRVILPVALDPTAFNVPAPLAQMNFLRPGGLPPGSDRQLSDAEFAVVERSLLKQITEAMCRLLLARDPARPTNSGAPPSKVKVFLSHAKSDGTTPARRLRDYMYSQTQLAVFYDENDIAFGSRFGQVIENDLESGDTAALIAVRSAQYANRPWCRREMSFFRRPRLEAPQAGGTERWKLHPTLVVESMEGGELSVGIPEFGNSPLIRWQDEREHLEELVVTTVIRDAMLASYHSAVGASIASSPDRSGSSLILNWLPDPTTLLLLPTIREAQVECDAIYPGRGLSGLELNILEEFFPKVTFRCFEEVLS